jgi:uncharacterized protein YbaR (Trm112 family)
MGMSKKNTTRTTVGGDMIQCPYCHAFSYPRLYKNPQTDEEKEAIVCGSCLLNLRPYINAMMKYEEAMKKEQEKKPTEENALILDNGDGTVDAYVDSEKVADKVLTEMKESSNL